MKENRSYTNSINVLPLDLCSGQLILTSDQNTAHEKAQDPPRFGPRLLKDFSSPPTIPSGYFPFTLVRDRSAQARALPPSHTRYRPSARPHTSHPLAAHSARLTQLAITHGPYAHGPSARPVGSDPARPSPLYTLRAQSIIGHEQPQSRGEWRRRFSLDPWCVSKGAPSPAQPAGARGSIPAVDQRPRTWLGPRIRFPGGTGGSDYIKEITPQSLPQPASRPR